MSKETDKEFLERMGGLVNSECWGTPEQEADQRRIKDIAQRLIDLQSCVSFFSSVIKSGEPWTDTCEAAMKEALRKPE